METKKDASFVAYMNGYRQGIAFDYSFFEKITIDGLSYLDRKQIIENGITVEMNHYLELIRKERDSQSKLGMMPFSEVYNRASNEDKKELHLSEKQLYFLRRNFIDENYIDYISLFKEGVLTKIENDFINSVRINDEMAPETSLNNIPVIFERIKDEFINNSPALLNYNLLDYLLDNKTTCETQLILLLNQILDEDNLIFLNNYISHNDSSKYFNASIEFIEDYWNKLLKRANSEDDILDYCYLILKNINNQMREIISKTQSFIDFINNHSNVLQKLQNNDDIESFVNTLKYFKIRFKFLTIDDLSNSIVLEYIINNTLFMINKNNIYSLTQKLDDSIDGIYTKILRSSKSEFINYINQNINIFVKDILLESNEINEDEGSLVKLLNTENITLEDKTEIIKKSNKPIFLISRINNTELYDILFQENKVLPNWENIYHFYKTKNEINDILVSFILEKDNAKTIGNESFTEQNKFKSEYASFATLLYMNKRITVDIIESLENNNEFCLDVFDYQLISIEKLQKLIDKKSIEFTQKNLNSIRSISQELADQFVLSNKSNYTKNNTDFNLNYSELSQIINNEDVSKDEKILIVKHNLEELCCPNANFNVIELIEEGNLFNLLNKQNVINLLHSKDFIFGINKNQERLQKRILLLAKTNSLFDDIEFMKEIIKFENDFEKLKSHKTVTINDRKGILLPLCDALQEKKIIHNYKMNNGKILLRK